MRNNLLILCGAIVALCSSQVSEAAVGQLADWTFDTGWNAAQTVYPSVNTYNATLLSGAPTLVATEFDTSGVVNNPGSFMRFKPNASGYGNSSTFVLQLTAGSSSLGPVFAISYDENPTSGSANVNSWRYSTDNGSTWSAAVVQTATETGWNTYNLSFGITVPASGNIWFMDTMSGANGLNHNVSFDNIIVTAVPEPINVALGAFGLGFAVVVGGRRVYQWAKA